MIQVFVNSSNIIWVCLWYNIIIYNIILFISNTKTVSSIQLTYRSNVKLKTHLLNFLWTGYLISSYNILNLVPLRVTSLSLLNSASRLCLPYARWPSNLWRENPWTLQLVTNLEPTQTLSQTSQVCENPYWTNPLSCNADALQTLFSTGAFLFRGTCWCDVRWFYILLVDTGWIYKVNYALATT